MTREEMDAAEAAVTASYDAWIAANPIPSYQVGRSPGLHEGPNGWEFVCDTSIHHWPRADVTP